MPGQFKFLFSPLTIGKVVVPNRISFSAHLTNFAENGIPSERHAFYYAARARGGTGLIITEELSVHPTDRAYENPSKPSSPKQFRDSNGSRGRSTSLKQRSLLS
jgi:2,4-dienoyl-CoA reductase-like NADH-dependent reductase (Old Yellow Enzyme family)